MHFKHILVPTDLSEISTDAFEYAAYQAKMENSRITLLNVLEPIVLPPFLEASGWDEEKIAELHDRCRTAARKILDEFVSKYFHGQQVSVEVQLTHRSTAEAICAFASETNCDLIVMSGHGRGGLGSLLLGSVVQKVLTQAPCVVLLVPSKLEPAPKGA